MIVHPPVASIRSALFAIALAAFASPAQAQHPSAQAVTLAKEIIAIKGTAASFNSMVPSMIERAKTILLQTNPMLSKDLNEVAVKLRKDYGKAADEPLNVAARVYAGKFSEQELRAILAFYKTPTGRKVIDEEPRILQESIRGLDEWSKKLSEDVLIKFRNEMRKKGHNL
jgi:hypothetical protein